MGGEDGTLEVGVDINQCVHVSSWSHPNGNPYLAQCHKTFLNPHESVQKVFQQIIVIMAILNGAMKVL